MLVADLLGDDLDKLSIRIFATDVAGDAVEFARRGIYPAAALANLPADLVERHFGQLDGTFEVSKAVRSLVIFGEHDLGHRAPFPRIDLVLCRNVLIYFTSELQRRALQLFAFSLRRGGYLVLGKAETVSPLPEYFTLEQPRLKVFRRVGEPAPIPTDRVLDVGPLVSAGARASRRIATPRRSEVASLAEVAREPSPGQQATRLLDALPIGVVTVDRDYHILSINLAARRLLRIHTAAVGEDLVHRVTPSLSGPVRTALDEAFRGETSIRLHRIADEVIDDGRDLRINCLPAKAAERNEDLRVALIVVDDVSELAQTRRSLEDGTERLAAELEHERARASLAVAEVRELRAANETVATALAKLRAENEELLVANEEAQAAAEEIETLNEELQATNEELETLNEELQATVEELTTTNDELQARTIELQTRDAEV